MFHSVHAQVALQGQGQGDFGDFLKIKYIKLAVKNSKDETKVKLPKELSVKTVCCVAGHLLCIS